MESTAKMLFAFMRDILYDPDKAYLDAEKLDPEYKEVGEGLQYLARCLKEERDLAYALSKGNLSVKLPPPDNMLAAPLKALHASLRHLTWTSQQVAKGDYQQRVDFLGEFADAFNLMTKQLDQRRQALEEENEINRQKTLALEQSYNLLQTVTDELQQWIIVLDYETKEPLFQNKTVATAFENHPEVERQLYEKLVDEIMQSFEKTTHAEMQILFENDAIDHYFSVVSYPMHWMERKARAHVISDITDEKQQLKQLENYAFQDVLTGVSNRYYGMQILRDWLEEKNDFSVCFVDLDNLKFVNDNFGHSEGDRYIISAAENLKQCAEDGLLSRLGGDEFMLLVPDIGRNELEECMEKSRDTMIESSRLENKPYFCSMSYGVVQVDKHSNLSSGELLSLADERMYEYKREHKRGRGQILKGG